MPGKHHHDLLQEVYENEELYRWFLKCCSWQSTALWPVRVLLCLWYYLRCYDRCDSKLIWSRFGTKSGIEVNLGIDVLLDSKSNCSK
jgi:hypothetical protein